MKRLILLLITGFISIPILAQLSGDGYYRLQNSGTKRYLTISNDKVDKVNKEAITGGNEGAVYGLRTINDPTSDPSSIIYISREDPVQPNYNFQGQGINPLQVLKNNNAVLRIYPDGNSYVLYGAKGGIALYMVDNKGSDGYIKIARKGTYPAQQQWDIRPVDGKTEYLGVAPDPNIKVGDKYYTTIYADYPFELSEGMKAYYICNTALGIQAGVERAELKEITGKIPANTPVILECSSLEPAKNKLQLSSTDAVAIKDNKLSGVYFCYIKMLATDPTKENTTATFTAIKNALKYDASKMRVLGLVDGQLGLVTASDDQLVVTDQGKYLPANKAYFKFTGSAGDYIPLLDKNAYQEAAELITKDNAIYKKDETGKAVMLINGKRATGNLDIPEVITSGDGITYPVTAIAPEAFKGNKILTQITIPSTITSIGEKALAGCENLKEIIVKSETPLAMNLASSSVFEGVNLETCILFVPENTLEQYVNHPIWGLFKNIQTETSGINNIIIDEKITDIYNLSGQKVPGKNNMTNGIYIINGKKVIRK